VLRTTARQRIGDAEATCLCWLASRRPHGPRRAVTVAIDTQRFDRAPTFASLRRAATTARSSLTDPISDSIVRSINPGVFGTKRRLCAPDLRPRHALPRPRHCYARRAGGWPLIRLDLGRGGLVIVGSRRCQRRDVLSAVSAFRSAAWPMASPRRAAAAPLSARTPSLLDPRAMPAAAGGSKSVRAIRRCRR